MLRVSTNFASIGESYRAGSEKLWGLITDTGRWAEWGPNLYDVECSDRVIGPGSTGRLKTAAGLWLPFQITEYEEGRRWRWRVASVNATDHRVEVAADGACVLWFDVPLFAAPYLLVCRTALRRIKTILCAENG